MELISETKISPYSPQLLEDTLKSLTYLAAREIEFCKIQKLENPDHPFIRYNVYGQLDEYMGCVIIRGHGNDRLQADITYQYDEKFRGVFEKIKTVWEKYNEHDVVLSNIVNDKKTGTTKPKVTPSSLQDGDGKIGKVDKLHATWDKMSPKTKNNFRKAWKIWKQMCKQYEKDYKDGKTTMSQPQIKDWRIRTLKFWKADTDRLRDVKEMGEFEIIK